MSGEKAKNIKQNIARNKTVLTIRCAVVDTVILCMGIFNILSQQVLIAGAVYICNPAYNKNKKMWEIIFLILAPTIA